MTSITCIALGMFMQSAALKIRGEHAWAAAFFVTAALGVSLGSKS